MENNIVENPCNFVIVDNVERNIISSVITDLIDSGINVLVLCSSETMNIYRELHDRYSGNYLPKITDFTYLGGKKTQMEIISGNYLANALSNKNVTTTKLACFLRKKSQCHLSPSFLIIDQPTSREDRNCRNNQIYVGVVFDSLDRAISKASDYFRGSNYTLF